jgi:hypothetical protein
MKALRSTSLADFDSAMAPIFVKNDPVYPFAIRIGYESGEDYWNDASSYRYARYISVPTLQVIAADDFLVFKPFRGRLQFCISNPYIMVVETKCGGHLGWRESPPENKFGLGTSWSDIATTDFIAAVLATREKVPGRLYELHGDSTRQQLFFALQGLRSKL